MGRPATTPASRVNDDALRLPTGGDSSFAGYVAAADIFCQRAPNKFPIEKRIVARHGLPR